MTGPRADADAGTEAGLVTAWVRRGPWGYIPRPREPPIEGSLREDTATLTVATLSDLITDLNVGRIAETSRHD